MAKDTDVVNPEPQIEEQPKPQISDPSAGQPLDQAGDSAVTLKAVEELLDRKFQSMKDTRLGKLETKLTDLEGAVRRYESLQDQGLSKEQALTQMQGDKELGDIKDQLASLLAGNVVVPSPGGGEKPWGERQQAILKDAGVQPDDARLTEFLKANTFESHDEYIEALDAEAFLWKQANAQKPQPSATSVANVVPSVPTGSDDYTTDKYVEDMIAARGKKSEIAAIKAKAIADGLDPDRITINM